MKIEGNKLVIFFDKLMSFPILNIFNPFYQKYKAALIYLFLGVITALANFLLFYLFYSLLNIQELISNVLSWIISAVFTFFVLREFYFEHQENEVLLELIKFLSSRVFTLIIEELLILLLVSYLRFDANIIKFILIFVIAIINYIITKVFVFR